MQQNIFSKARLTSTVCVFLFVLSGCIFDDEDDTKTAQGIVGDDTIEMTLSGSVGDGPVINGRIVLRNANDEIVALQTSDEFAHYEMTVGVSGSEFPLIVSVDDGIDLVTGTVPDFPLLAGISTPGAGQVVNLNPMGTLAVKVAQHMDGGLSAENLAVANRVVRTTLNFGLDTARFPDFISTDVNDQIVANVVRSSEAFGEAIRRTRDALISTGVTSAEQVLDALSADLIDGKLDGRGAAGVDPRITAVNHVVSAQVALETMANRLKVGGVEATDRLDEAILRVTPGNPAVALTDSIDVTDELLTQVRVLLDAVIRVDSNPELTVLRQAIDLVEPGQSQQDLPLPLQNGLSDALGVTIRQFSVATTQDIGMVNDAVRNGFDAVDNGNNHAPTIGGNPTTDVVMGSLFDFTPTASDQDNDSLTFSISGQPSWASFSSATGRLSGTPGEDDIDSQSVIRITVSDGSATATLPSFTLMISILVDGPANHAPSISGSAEGIVQAGSSYTFRPIASDQDNDPLTFWISGKPSWASFNPQTGLLSGMPGVGDIGSYSGIRINVSDSSASASLPVFTITVNGLPNRTPSIGGSPASEVMVDSGYSFTPTTSDPDDDLLTFSISGKPSWANFNSGTGRLSGTPGVADVGTYSGIRISVSDGAENVSLSHFSIEVIAQALGSATLFWTAPTLNADGSTLNDLAGFKVYHGTAVDSMTTVETIKNPSVTSYLVENLHSGSWYFKVTALDATGNESLDSDVVSKLVQP